MLQPHSTGATALFNAMVFAGCALFQPALASDSVGGLHANTAAQTGATADIALCANNVTSNHQASSDSRSDLRSSNVSALTASDWRYATDPYGSEAFVCSALVDDQGASIAFSRVPRVDAQRNSWVELIYDLPEGNLNSVTRVKITYKSSEDLVIKLSQKDYGGDGDKTYAHYQTKIDSADQWQQVTVDLDDFQRPSWTPQSSVDKGIIKENISALYFVPSLTDERGGNAELKIQDVQLLP